MKRAKFSPGGVQSEVYEVHFVTTSGVRDMTEFTISEYTPENVKARLAQMADMHEKVFS